MDYKEFIDVNRGKSPEDWEEQAGYIATVRWTDDICYSEWSEGVEYIVLDDNHIACRRNGDWIYPGDWEILSPEGFFELLDFDYEYQNPEEEEE